MYEARGMNGQLLFDGVYVTLARKGFWARSQIGLGEKRIPVTSIGSINWKPASRLVNGYIQLAPVGDVQRRPRYGQRNLDAARDENSVTFRHVQMPAFEQVRAVLETAIAARSAPGQAPMQGWGPPPQPVQAPADPAAQLRQLDHLRQQGLISEAEYQSKRAEIIARL